VVGRRQGTSIYPGWWWIGWRGRGEARGDRGQDGAAHGIEDEGEEEGSWERVGRRGEAEASHHVVAVANVVHATRPLAPPCFVLHRLSSCRARGSAVSMYLCPSLCRARRSLRRAARGLGRGLLAAPRLAPLRSASTLSLLSMHCPTQWCSQGGCWRVPTPPYPKTTTTTPSNFYTILRLTKISIYLVYLCSLKLLSV
jgi:hypothetical protein